MLKSLRPKGLLTVLKLSASSPFSESRSRAARKPSTVYTQDSILTFERLASTVGESSNA